MSCAMLENLALNLRTVEGSEGILSNEADVDNDNHAAENS